MPNIREYDQSISNQAALPDARAGESSFVNHGLDYLASATDHAGQVIDQVNEQNNNLKAQSLSVQAKLDWQEQYNQMEKDAAAAGGGADGFTDKFKKSFSDYKQNMLNGSGLNGRYQQVLSTDLDRTQSFYIDNAVRFEAKQNGIAAANTVSNNGQQLVNLVLADPSQATAATKQYSDMIDGLATIKDGKTRDQLKQDGATKINDAYLTGTMLSIDRLNISSPSQKAAVYQDMLDSIRKDGDLQAKVSPPVFHSVMDTLEKKIDFEKQQGDSLFKFQLGIANDKMSTTGQATPGFGEAEIRANAKTPVELDQMLMQTRSAAAVGNEQTATKDMTLPDIYARVQTLGNDMTSKSGIEFETAKAKYQAALQVAQQKSKAMADDPAQFMASNDTIVAGKTSDFAQDPSNPLKAQAYAAAQIARQQAVSPNGPPKILSFPMIDQFKQQLTKFSNDPNGIEQQRALLTQEAAKWGDKWPQVASEYFANKALNNFQYVASGMSKNSQSMTDELIRAAALKESDLKANITQPGNYQNTVKTAVDGALTDFKGTLQGTRGNDAQVLTAYQDAAERVILSRSLDGKDHSGDASDIVGKLIGNEFTIKSNVRIPNDPAVNIDAVVSGMNNAKSNLLFSKDIRVPPGYQGDTPDAQRQQFASSLKSFGKFVTKGDNSGVYFVDNNGDYVRNAAGQPMQWSWSDLQAPAARGRTWTVPGSGGHGH